MVLRKVSGIAFVPVLAVVLGIMALGTATVAIINPKVFGTISQTLSGSGQELTTKIGGLQSKYLAKGASEDTILVKFKSGVSNEQSAKIHQNNGTKVKKKVSGIDVEVVSIPEGAKVGDTIDKFKKSNDVEFAEPNFLATAQLDPNDSLYSSQWNLKKISAPLAWDDAQGGDGPIAVVDTGVQSNHPDLSGEVLQGYNFVSDSSNTADDNGHGTHVSGIASAVTNNGVGVASIGFRSNILPVKVLNSAGSGTYSDVSSGIIYAADNGARVINLSLGGPSSSVTLQNAVTYATNKGSFVVAAAGNSGSSTPLYPAACAGALAITATDSSDNLAGFSNYGKNVFVGAPGVGITSTYNNSGYTSLSGTSMSAPHFSGLLEMAAAYIGSTNKSVTNQQLLDYLKTTTDKVGGYPYDSNGWNQYFGYGRINASKLIGQIKEAPVGSPTVTAAPTRTPTSYSPTPVPDFSKEPPGRSKFGFNVELEGSIDSFNDDRTVVKVKIKNISQNIKLEPDDLVDLYLDDNSEIKYKGQPLNASELESDDKINVKALWSEDKLIAKEITVQNRSSNSSNPPDKTSTPPGKSDKTNPGNSDPGNNNPGNNPGKGKGKNK